MLSDDVPEPELEFRSTREEFEASVLRGQEAIRDGDVFQVVLSQRLDLDCPADPIDVYRVLRTVNPSPYMYYLQLQDADGHDFAVVGSSPETLVKLVCRDRDQAVADARLAALDAGIRQRLAPQLYSQGDESMVERVMRRLLAAKQTCVTAESCTGGLVGEMLTRMPGSSAAFLGGAIVYTNAEKERQLGVSHATLVAHGAVSDETVREMAKGARERFDSDYAVAISGIAGPDGGTAEKPVGLVYVAVHAASGDDVRRFTWSGDRATNIADSIQAALDLLLERVVAGEGATS